MKNEIPIKGALVDGVYKGKPFSGEVLAVTEGVRFLIELDEGLRFKKTIEIPWGFVFDSVANP